MDLKPTVRSGEPQNHVILEQTSALLPKHLDVLRPPYWSEMRTKNKSFGQD
eukprot:m.89183 g.89183  ORF g.89183 m.89183 type:complete len:51 (+) comp13207_c1_seq1:3867-4019(+)